MNGIALSSVACPALPYFFLYYLINCTTFRKTSLNIKYVFSPSLRILSEELLILKRNQRDTTLNFIGLYVKYACSYQILVKTEFPQRFSKNNRTSNFMKTRPVGAELFSADGRS